MKITKEEILNISDLINIDLTDVEIEEIEQSISQIVTRFDEMLAIEEVGHKMITPNKNTNEFNQEFGSVDKDELFKNVNNFDGEYVKTKKVIGDE